MKFIIICPHYYGMGATVNEAKTNLKKAGGHLKQYKVFITDDDDASIDPINGGIHHAKDTAVTLVSQRGCHKK